MSVVDNHIVRFINDDSPHKVGLSKEGVLLDLSGLTVKMSIEFEAGTVTYTGTAIAGDPDYNVQFPFVAADVANAGRFTYDIEVQFGSGKLTFVKDILELIEKRGAIIRRYRGDTYTKQEGITKDNVLIDLSQKTTNMLIELSSGVTKIIEGTPIENDKKYNVEFDFQEEDTSLAGTHIYAFKDSSGEIYARNDFKLIDDVTKT